MSIQELITVLPVPEAPIETGASDQWPSIEKSLGISLPGDYKSYINTFGTGVVGYLIRVLNPFSPHKTLFDFFYMTKEIIEIRKRYKNKYGNEWCPYPLYPEPEGLLPWANTLDGDHLFWQTKGPPADWPIILAEVKSKDFEVFTLSTTVFLKEIVTGRLRSNILADIDPYHLFEAPTGLHSP